MKNDLLRSLLAETYTDRLTNRHKHCNPFSNDFFTFLPSRITQRVNLPIEQNALLHFFDVFVTAFSFLLSHFFLNGSKSACLFSHFALAIAKLTSGCS